MKKLLAVLLAALMLLACCSAFAEEIGADVYTPDAGSAAEKAKEIAAALA